MFFSSSLHSSPWVLSFCALVCQFWNVCTPLPNHSAAACRLSVYSLKWLPSFSHTGNKFSIVDGEAAVSSATSHDEAQCCGLQKLCDYFLSARVRLETWGFLELSGVGYLEISFCAGEKLCFLKIPIFFKISSCRMQYSGMNKNKENYWIFLEVSSLETSWELKSGNGDGSSCLYAELLCRVNLSSRVDCNENICNLSSEKVNTFISTTSLYETCWWYALFSLVMYFLMVCVLFYLVFN